MIKTRRVKRKSNVKKEALQQKFTMPLSRMHSVCLVGLDALPVEVEVDVKRTDEKTILVIVGLPDAAVKESKDRVLTAIKNSGFSPDNMKCTVNLAPGDLKKEGSLYDLPIALGLIGAMEALNKKKEKSDHEDVKNNSNDIENRTPQTSNVQSDYLFVGELGLSGELRPIYGALASAMLARQLGKKGILLPAANAKEAAALPNIAVYAIHHLKEAVHFLLSPESFVPVKAEISEDIFQHEAPLVDFADIKGQAHVKRAMEIAAAGGHNVILSGPPGSGKTMIAKALSGIIPELTIEEALEVTKIHSISGLLDCGSHIVKKRPFRSPHHTVSYAGLIGGGTVPRPGEVSLAHCGVLFLDELPEFSRTVLEVLRQPLEDRKVTISRAMGNFTFPSDFICIAAMNPCPCGYLGHPDKRCTDTQAQIDRYRGKISGPLWDRIDMHIEVPALRYRDIAEGLPGESSLSIRNRVKTARIRQYQRYGKTKINSQLSSRELKLHSPLTPACHEILRQAVDSLGISARACDRLVKVALTIADLAGSSQIKEEHLMEALAFRQNQKNNYSSI